LVKYCSLQPGRTFVIFCHQLGDGSSATLRHPKMAELFVADLYPLVFLT